MKYLDRILEKRLRELFGYYPVVAVTGARQTGKTTLVRHVFPAYRVVTFDPAVDVGNARSDPDFFLQGNPAPAFLDEIQYAPELAGAIKRKVDRDGGNGHYLVSGSQHFSVIKNMAESLAGRVGILELPPLSYRELTKVTARPPLLSFLLEDRVADLLEMEIAPDAVFPRLWRGGYPKLLQLPDRAIAGYWESYMRTYVERDVRSIADIGSLQTFGRFIALLAALTGQEINHAQLGRELGVDRKTALRWAEIAEASYLWRTIPAYARNPVKRILGRGKGYFTDTGFACSLQRIVSPAAVPDHPLAGRLFETFVAMELVKGFQQFDFKPNLYHYRSYAGAEVDLIMEFNGTLYPVEIKMKSQPSRRDLAGIESFRECFPREKIATGLVLCGAERPHLLADHAMAVPWWLV